MYLVEKLIALGGIITGFHGTAASLARLIETRGIKDQICVEGEVGIWFWDDDVKQNAKYNALRKADELGEDQGAIITAQLTHPQPDWSGRKQWLGKESNIKILGIEYLDNK